VTAAGDRARGLDLYEWNAAVSAAVLHDLAHLEVALRNVYDRALSVAATPRGRHWTAVPRQHFGPVIKRASDGSSYDANDKPRQQIAYAMRSAGGPAAPPGKVIAELSFGFWRYLSTSAHEVPLWLPHLRHGFVPRDLPASSRPTGDAPASPAQPGGSSRTAPDR